MSDVQFDRVYRLTVYRQRPIDKFIGEHPEWFEEIGNAVTITGHRIQYKVERNLASEPNTAEIIITNLAETTRRAFQILPLRVHLEAGFSDEPRLLFVGDVKPQSGSKHTGTEWETKLLLGDGYRSFAQARANRSYKPGTSILTILRDVARTMSLELPKNLTADPALQGALKSGETVTGWAANELTRLLAPYGYSWSMQAGKLQVLRDEEARTDTIRVIESSMIIGSPEIATADKPGKPPKLTVKTRLYPELVPGGRIEMRGLEIRGLYKLTKCTHDGDSRSGPWHTTAEAVPL